MKATGGVASYNLTDPATGDVKAVTWAAPALNTIYYRYSEEEIRYILTYGRPFSPMPAWGVAGGGPMNDQQIDTLLAYLKSIQIDARRLCRRRGRPAGLPVGSPAGRHPAGDRGRRPQVGRRTARTPTYGEALYNLSLASGAYSCARCHTPGWSYGDPGRAGPGRARLEHHRWRRGRHFPNEADMITFIKSGSTQGAKYGTQGQGTGRMPGFGNMLTDEQIQRSSIRPERYVEYVRGAC